jgi:hypothetical protein
MKMKEAHIVPLSREALKILKSLQPYTGANRFLFPSLRTTERPMSDNSINAALRRLGYSNDEMTGHGFRSLASTSLNEQGLPPDVIELQLALAERNKGRAVYNRAARLEQRREMMQAWADFLDELRNPTGASASRGTKPPQPPNRGESSDGGSLQRSERSGRARPWDTPGATPSAR